MNNNIVKTAFITLISSFFIVGLCAIMISNGEMEFSIKTFIQNLNRVNNSQNLYNNIVKTLCGGIENYSKLSTFQKNFFISSSIMSLIDLIKGVADIPVIGWLLNGMLNSLIATLSVITMLIECLLKALSFMYVLIMAICISLGDSFTQINIFN